MLTEILSLLLLTLQPVQSEKCYAAAMEGGGMCGAYEAGALMALTEKLSPSEIAYNIIGGISIGAYNSCWLSGFEVGDERNMAIYLQNVWLSITKTSQIYKYRFPLIYALFRAPSLIDNTPAYNLIQQYTGNPIKRNITVAATDISTGELINFNQTIGRENMTTACWASGAYPAAFPPIKIDERYFIDGCATSNLDGFVVVDWCRDMGFKDKDIVVDLYYDVHPNILVQERVNTTRETLARLTKIRHYYKSNWFISQLKTDFPDVEIRYEITPSAAIHNYSYIVPGDFQYKINLGYNDTILLLKKSKAQRQRDASERFLIDPHFR